MKIIILSNTCSEKKYESIAGKRTIKTLDTNQKFFRSIIKGFRENGICDITCISLLPVSYRTYPERYIKREEEIVDGIRFIYCKTYNYPYIRNVLSVYEVLNEVKRMINEVNDGDVIVLTDGLHCEFSSSIRYLHRVGKKVYTVVTDVPSMMIGTGRGNSIKKYVEKKYGMFGDKIIQERYDGYIFLTEQMNQFFNCNNKPSVVVEGIFDDLGYSGGNRVAVDNSLPVVLYAGKYNEEFGSLMLAKCAPLLKGICNIVMFGGNGNCSEQLREIAKKNDNLIVGGIIDLHTLLQYEANADLLVNPRPNDQEFTKYSFPSKTLEYMGSGTPVLTFKLEGIPKEYYDRLYFFEGDSVEQMAESIKRILGYGQNILSKKGELARNFVSINKNVKAQTSKMLELMMGQFEYEGKKIGGN